MRRVVQILSSIMLLAILALQGQALMADDDIDAQMEAEAYAKVDAYDGASKLDVYDDAAGGGGDFTSQLINKFQTVAKQWEKSFHDIAKKIFLILAAIALFIKFAPILAGGGSRDLGDFTRELVMFVLTTGVVLYLVEHGPELFLDLFNFFTKAADETTHNAGPQEILSATLELLKATLKSLQSGWEEYNKNVKQVSASVGWTKIGQAIVTAVDLVYGAIAKFLLGLMGLTCCIVAVILAAIISIKYAVILASAYVIAYAGVIILGFAGWGFTRDVIASYFKTAAGIGIQLMCYVLLMAVGQGLVLEQCKSITSTTNTVIQLGEYATFLVCIIMWFEMINLVPPMVAGIAGAPTMREPSVKNMGAMTALAAAPLVLPAAAAAGGAAGAAATKAAAAAAGTTATKGQVFAGALKGAMGNMKEAGGRAVKAATDGGSFGSVMKSAAGMENTGPSSPKAVQERQKQAQDEQKQAKRDEMQAQTLQAMQDIAGGGGQGANSADAKDVNIKVDANATADAKSEAEAKADINRAAGSMNGSGPSAASGNNITADATQIAPEGGPAATPGTSAPAAPSSNGSFFQRLLNRGKGETAAQRAAEEQYFRTHDNTQKPTDFDGPTKK